MNIINFKPKIIDPIEVVFMLNRQVRVITAYVYANENKKLISNKLICIYEKKPMFINAGFRKPA
jgi:hypothetical protein